ncbi:MAG: cobalamin-binding protein [Desulfobacteria bacterium]
MFPCFERTKGRPVFNLPLFFALILAVSLGHVSPLEAQRVFVDELDRKVVVPDVPTRIVSLGPNITEILYALNLGDRIVGVTKFSDYPREAKQKPRVGTYVNFNIEKIVSLQPDLIIATYGGNPKTAILRLEELGQAVYVTKAKTVEDVLNMIESIGMITDTREMAGTILNGLKKRIKGVTDRVRHAPRPLVFLQINAKPLMTVGPGSFHSQLIEIAGGRNLAEGGTIRYPQYSIEDVLQRGPDYILISTMDRAGLFEEQKAHWMRWQNIPAVKNNRICFLDSDLIDRASPRIVDGLEEMAKLIHPELF